MDEQIIEAARLGAEWAWTQIYRDLSPAVLRYLRAHGALDAEDLLGDVFVQMVRRIPDFTGDAERFRSWVFVIAHNRLIDEWRRGPRGTTDIPLDHESAPVELADSAEADALNLLAEQHVRGVLDRLSPDQRNVLLLRFIADLSIDQTARVLGKRPGAIKALQSRALSAIRREISRGAISL